MLPQKYAWLAQEPAPRHLVEAVKLVGTMEVKGPANNPTIIGWAKELGLTKTYSGDEIPWCGLFAAIVVHRAQRQPVADPLWARNWAKFGVDVAKDAAELGDILVFVRNGGGHVGLYVGEDQYCFHVLGGNQSDSVNVTRITKDRCIAVRRPAYNNKPTNIRKVFIGSEGVISTDEA